MKYSVNLIKIFDENHQDIYTSDYVELLADKLKSVGIDYTKVKRWDGKDYHIQLDITNFYKLVDSISHYL